MGESSRPVKKAWEEGRVEPPPAVEVPAIPVAAEEPVSDVPAKEMVPEPTGAAHEEGEIPAATEATVVILDEEGSPAAADAQKEGQEAAAPSPPAVSAPGAKKKTPPTTEEEPTAEKPRVVAEKTGEKRKETGSAPLSSMPCPSRPRVEGALERHGRPGPKLTTMGDAGLAAVLLAGIPTYESKEEVRGMSQSAILDMTMVSMVQAVNGVLGLREALARSTNSLGRAVDRADKHKKESAAQAESLTRLRNESKAREEGLKKTIKEVEGRAEEAARRVASLKLELDTATNKLKVAALRAEERDRDLQHFKEQAAAARDKVLAAERRVAAAEKAAIDAGHERAGAVAHADEASARAGEAENRAWEAEARAKEAEAREKEAEARAKEAESRAQQAIAATEKAVEVYKSSPEFKEEVTEASLDAYVQGFDSCKARLSEIFKLDASELDKIRPQEPDEEPAEEAGEEEEAGTGKP